MNTNLATVLLNAFGDYLKSLDLTDLRIGTVATVNPLSITINTQMAPIPSVALIPLLPVRDIFLQINGHTHPLENMSHSHEVTVTGSATTTVALNDLSPPQPELEHTHDVTVTSTGETSVWSPDEDETGVGDENAVFYIDGVAQPVEGNRVYFNKGLVVGDKVYMLAVENGNRFLILSKV